MRTRQQTNMRMYVRNESVFWPVSLLQSDGKRRLVVADTRQTRLAGSQPDLPHTHGGAAFTATSAYLRLLLEGVRGVPLGYAHFALPADGEEKVNLWRSRVVLESCPSQRDMQDTLSDSIRPSVSFSLFLNLTCAHSRVRVALIGVLTSMLPNEHDLSRASMTAKTCTRAGRRKQRSARTSTHAHAHTYTL